MSKLRGDLSWTNIIGYSFGDIANNFAFAMGALFLLNYYTDVAGISAVAAGTMLMLVRIFDAFADIAAGRIADSVNTKWGKFRPFMLFGSVPLMAFSVLVFCVPSSWSEGGKLFYAYATYMGLGVCYSLVNIPYGSLATAMTQQPTSRAMLSMSRSMGAALTFVCLAFVLAPKIKSHSASEMAGVYLNYTLALAVAGVALYVMCFLCTVERVQRPKAKPALGASLKTLFRNKPLLILCAGALSALIASFSVTASNLYYCRYVLGDTSYFTYIVMAQMLVGMVGSAPLVPILVSKVGKKSTFLIGSGVATVGYLIFYAFALSGVWTALLCLAFASVGMGLAMTVIWALEADTVEWGEYESGVRIEGLTYSFFSFTRKCGQAIGGSIPAFLLGIYGYVANAPQQTDEAIFGIRAAIGLAPAVFAALTFIIMVFYPLNEKKYKEIIEEIKTRRAKEQEQE